MLGKEKALQDPQVPRSKAKDISYATHELGNLIYGWRFAFKITCTEVVKSFITLAHALHANNFGHLRSKLCNHVHSPDMEATCSSLASPRVTRPGQKGANK